jgi:transposase
MIRSAPKSAAVYGVDLGKNLFHVVGLDDRGAVVQRVKFRRHTLLAFFERADRTIVGMEACPGSQWLARKLQAMGHQVRIVPAQFVKPYVKSQKNDTIDAEAIAEAVTRPTMRFTQVRTPEQVDRQALHRIRDQLVSSRTRLINQVRAFCLEYGVAIRQGAGVFRLDLPRVLADESNDLSPAMRHMLSELFEDVVRLDQRIAGVTREIEGLAARDDRARRLMTIPGIGRSRPPRCSRRWVMAVSSDEPATCQHGSAWCPGNIPPAARPHSLESANGATVMPGDCSSTGHGLA